MADETSEFNSESTGNILPNTSDNLKCDESNKSDATNFSIRKTLL